MLAFAVPYPATRSWVIGATFIVMVFSIVVQAGTIGWISPFGGGRPTNPISLEIKDW